MNELVVKSQILLACNANRTYIVSDKQFKSAEELLSKYETWVPINIAVSVIRKLQFILPNKLIN